MKLLRVIPIAFATICMLFFPGLIEARQGFANVSLNAADDAGAKALANDAAKKAKDAAKKAGDAAKDAAAKSELLTDEVLSEVFTATEASVDDRGRVTVVYDFESKNEDLLFDWSPDIDTTKSRIRWSRGLEGTWSTVEHGLVIADHGIFLHKAQWKDDVKVRVSYLSMAQSDKRDILSTVFVYDKGKRIVASNMGAQCMRLSKTLRPKGAPIPKSFPRCASSQKFTFGMEIADGVLHATRSDSRQVDTRSNDKFLAKLGPGKAGLAWRGRVNGFIFKVEIEGTLDLDWLAEQVEKD